MFIDLSTGSANGRSPVEIRKYEASFGDCQAKKHFSLLTITWFSYKTKNAFRLDTIIGGKKYIFGLPKDIWFILEEDC